MKKKIGLSLLLCTALFFSACNSESKPESRPELISAAGNAVISTVENIILPKPRPELVFTTESVLLSEPDKIFSRKDNMELTSVDGVTYAFEKAIPLDDRMDCIEKTQAILDKTGLEKEIHIYVYTNNTYDSTYITDGTIYTSAQSWNSPEYISRILLGLFGEYCNYGAIYGYATLLHGQLNRTVADKLEAASQTSMKAMAQALLAICTRVKNEFVWKSEMDCFALDLNILCFDEAFVSQKEKENVMSIAANFVSDYITVHGTDKFHELLLNSGIVEGAAFFGEALSHFYSENNIDYIPSNILYTFGGHSYDYIARCRYATFFIENNWYDEEYERNPLTYKIFYIRIMRM